MRQGAGDPRERRRLDGGQGRAGHARGTIAFFALPLDVHEPDRSGAAEQARAAGPALERAAAALRA
jgi:hypothetical protein